MIQLAAAWMAASGSTLHCSSPHAWPIPECQPLL